jgi:hypothetical protein
MNIKALLQFVAGLPAESQRLFVEEDKATALSFSEGKLEVMLLRSVSGKVWIQVFLGSDSNVPEEIKLGSYHLGGLVESCRSRNGRFLATLTLTTRDDELEQRKSSRFLVFAMNLEARVEGESELFMVRIMDISPQGLGIRPSKHLASGLKVSLFGWEPYLKNPLPKIDFTVRSTFKSGICGLEIAPSQNQAVSALGDLFLVLQSTRRFWESLVEHARNYGRKEAITGVQVGVDFACRQLRNRKEVVRCLMDENKFEELADAMGLEMECVRLEGEIKAQQERLEKLMAGQQKRKKEVNEFLEALEGAFSKE